MHYYGGRDGEKGIFSICIYIFVQTNTPYVKYILWFHYQNLMVAILQQFEILHNVWCVSKILYWIAFSLPFLQIIILFVLPKSLGSSGANYAKNLLRVAILIQYIPRLYRFLPLLVGQSPIGFIFESAWANFVINLLTFILSGHVVGSCWYLFGLQVNCLLQNLVMFVLYCLLWVLFSFFSYMDDFWSSSHDDCHYITSILPYSDPVLTTEDSENMFLMWGYICKIVDY